MRNGQNQEAIPLGMPSVYPNPIALGMDAGKPIAMGYLAREWEAPGTTVYALVRGKQLPMSVSAMPFVAPDYYRG